MIDTTAAATRVLAFLASRPLSGNAATLPTDSPSSPVLRARVLSDLAHGQASPEACEEVNLYLAWHERFVEAGRLPHLAFLAGGPGGSGLRLVDVDVLLTAVLPNHVPDWAQMHAEELWADSPAGSLRARPAYQHLPITVAGVPIAAATPVEQVAAIVEQVVMPGISLPADYDPETASR